MFVKTCHGAPGNERDSAERIYSFTVTYLYEHGHVLETPLLRESQPASRRRLRVRFPTRLMSATTSSTRIRVLYVGTDDETASALESGTEFLVETAPDGETARRLVRSGGFDCVVSEHELDDTDGLELLGSVRANRPALPFILSVEGGSERVASEAISAGVTDYVPKDTDDHGSVLSNRIRDAVRSYRVETATAEQARALETANEGISILDSDGRFAYVNEAYGEIYGYDPESLLGEHWELLYEPGQAERVHEEILPAVHETGYWEGETTGVRSDGSTFPERHSLTETEDGGLICVVRDITDQKRRTERLSELNDLTRSLMGLKRVEDICSEAVAEASDRLHLGSAVIALYDRSDGTTRTFTGDDQAPTYDTDRAWDAFVENRTIVDRQGRATVFAPLGKHGVFIAVEPEDGRIDGDREFVETVARNVASILDTVDREAALRKRDEALKERNETLRRLDHINTVIRDIDEVIVGANTRQEIEQAVCSRLANTDPIRFAWIGTVDSSDGTVRSSEWAGIERDYLQQVTPRATTPIETQEPAGRAAYTRRSHVLQPFSAEPPYEPWEQAALERGYHACISVPLIYQDTLYGVLTVYASDADAFDVLEEEVFEQLGRTIAHAINAVESKRALVSDQRTELELDIGDTDVTPVRLAREADCTLTFEDLITQTDGGFRVFFTTEGAPPERVLAAAEGALELRAVTLLEAREETCRFTATTADESLVSFLVDHGAVPKAIRVGEGEDRLVVDLSSEAEIRSFVDTLQSRYPGIELVAQRSSTESSAADETPLSGLTDRQKEVLRTALASGYFESPRRNNASDLAELLDISQPTFTAHLRKAQRTVFGNLLSDPPAEH